MLSSSKILYELNLLIKNIAYFFPALIVSDLFCFKPKIEEIYVLNCFLYKNNVLAFMIFTDLLKKINSKNTDN